MKLSYQRQTPRLHSVRHVTVQHSHAADLTVVGDADTADVVVRDRGHLTGAAGAVSIRVEHVVTRLRIGVQVVYVVRCVRILKQLIC